MGAGRVGTALAVLLAKAGHRIVAASGGGASGARVERFLPGVPFLPAGEAASRGEAVILGVPDDRIAQTCEGLASAGRFGPGRAVVHLSGSVSLAALEPARAAGARVLAVHPLQTFPDVEAALARLPGSAVAVTARDEDGYVLGERLARDAGGRPFRLPDERKPLYHAAAVFSSNYLAVALALAERLFVAARVEDPAAKFGPLAEATLANVLSMGTAESLTGPVSRGDAGTVRSNLEALRTHAPDVVPAYVALARAALDLAERAGRLPGGGRAAVEEVLQEWR